MGGMIAASIFKASNSELLRAIGNVWQQGKRMNSLHQPYFSRHARPLTLLEGFAYDSILKLFRFWRDAFVKCFEVYLKDF
jgi:hypothetical protein